MEAPSPHDTEEEHKVKRRDKFNWGWKDVVFN